MVARGVFPDRLQSGATAHLNDNLDFKRHDVGDGFGSRRTEGEGLFRTDLTGAQLLKHRSRALLGDGADQLDVRRARALLNLLPQSLEGDMEFVFGGQGNGTIIAAVEADLAAGQAAQGMRHHGPAGFWVPFKDVVRAKVEALQILAAGVVIDAGKPRESLAQMAEQRHGFFLPQAHE